MAYLWFEHEALSGHQLFAFIRSADGSVKKLVAPAGASLSSPAAMAVPATGWTDVEPSDARVILSRMGWQGCREVRASYRDAA